MLNNPDLLGELSGEQEVIGSLGMDIKIIYRGFTAYIDELTVDEDGNLIIELTNSQGEHTSVNAGHVKGDQGDTGYYFTPSIDEDYDLSWSNNGGLPNPPTKNIKGVKGDKGDPGTSPAVTVTRTSDGATVVIVDDSGTTSANLYDGYHIGSVQLTGGSVMPGQTATYTMYLNDSDTNPTPVGTFQVRNGSDGTGVGDMLKSDYDSDGDGKVNDADHADSADTAATATTAANAEKLGGQLPSYYATAEDIPTVPTNVSVFTNDAGYITSDDVFDIVPDWAMQSTKPTYTAAEVGAITSADIVGKQDKPLTATSLPTSGAALTDNTIYNIPSSTPVSTYQFAPPANGGWAHGYFTTGSSVSITFGTGSEFSPEAPTFETSKKYQFDIDNGVWMFSEVATS